MKPHPALNETTVWPVMSSETQIPAPAPRIKSLPSVERLRELLAYDPATGVIRWKVARGPQRAGSVAGKLNHKGYRSIKIDGVDYQGHRLAWKMATGADPVETIDHVNNVPGDNRIVNLREATPLQQMLNKTSAKGSSSKYLGVCWNKNRAKWKAQIRLRGNVRHLGYFTCEVEAALAYDAAAAKHNGLFANLNFPGGS